MATAAITGVGTTYALPNYRGELLSLTPQDTPFLTAIGGLSGGGMQTTSVQWEWTTFDLRDAAASNTKLEGQVAPTAEARVRGNVSNVVEIHQERVTMSYTKAGATGQFSGINNNQPGNVSNELDWQVRQMLVQMARDVEKSFLTGTYQLPVNNTTARQTRGLIPAITSNVQTRGTVMGVAAVTATPANTVTITAHGMANGTQVLITNVVGSANLTNDTVYWVISQTANTFQLAATKGGVPIALGAGTVDVLECQVLDIDAIEDACQAAYDNGGLMQSEAATIMVGSWQKRAISEAYANAYGKFFQPARNVGGVNVDTITTNFGVLNVMLNRHMPRHKAVIVSLDQCVPVFLEVPGKGHFFAEPLAKTGASEDVMLYGEVGLMYGNERSHAVITGLTVA